MISVDLSGLLTDLDDSVQDELSSTPTVIHKGDDLNVEDLPIIVRKWYKLDDVVAVVADLKNSTKLGTNKWAASTASIYQASTGGVVKIFNQFEADFLAIQGDGAFALFWGESRYERALCAGITIKTFSRDMVGQLEAKWPDNLPETGLKVGVANSRLLAKRVGTPRNPAQQEPVWAGKAVNYAAKAAQQADRGELIVTGSVWDEVEKNDYLAVSCPCQQPSLGIWADIEIDRLPEGDPEAQGRVLSADWCDIHGAEYCSSVLSGERHREDVKELRTALQRSQMRTAIRSKAQEERKSQRARHQGLTS